MSTAATPRQALNGGGDLNGEQRADMVKADLENNGGVLPLKAAEKFISIAYDATPVLSAAFQRKMRGPKEEISRFWFDGQVLMASPGELTALDQADRTAPTTAKITLDAQEYRGETWIGYDVFEDNIEGEGIMGLWLDHLAKRVGLDVANAAVNGDTTLPANSQENKLLRKQHGWLKLASTHEVDADSAHIDEDLLGDVVEAMPSKYMTADEKNMRMFHQYKIALNWRRQVARRGTALGDAALVQGAIPDYAGIPLIGDSTIKIAGGLTSALFLNPKNMIIGFWREVRIEMFKDITIQAYKLVVSCRFAVNYFNPDAVVKVTNIKPMVRA